MERDKARMKELDDKLVKLTNDDKSFVMTSSYLLKLANVAPNLFKSSKPRLKNKLLKILLSNLILNEKRLYFTVVEPFSSLSKIPKTSNWLGRRDSNPRMPGPKPGALPLGDALIIYLLRQDTIDTHS